VVGIASREAPYSPSIIVDLDRELLGLLGPEPAEQTRRKLMKRPTLGDF
jgi:hypothetical protein